MKKILMWLIVALVTIAGSISAMADGTPEIPPAEKKPNAGYDGGFFLQNDTGSFKLVIGGRVQPLFYLTKAKEQPSDFTFKIRRARLDFGATVAEKGHAKIVFMHSTGSALYSGVQLYYAHAGYAFHPAFDVTVGIVGMPLSMLGGGSSLGYHLIEPPIAITQDDTETPITPLRSAFGNPDGIGIELSGDIGKFSYVAALINGAARAVPATLAAGASGGTVVIKDSSGGVESNYDLNFNKHVSFGARVGYNILEPVDTSTQMDMPYSEKPKLTVSMGGDYQGYREYYSGTTQTNPVKIKNLLTGSVGAAFRWRGFSITGEIYGRRTKLDNPGPTTAFDWTMDDFGYYLDSGYFIIKNKLEVAMQACQIIRQGPHNNSFQFGGGVNWYLKENKLKVQLTYNYTELFSDVTQEESAKKNYIGAMLTAAF